jgi:hypothetical protein
LLRTLFAYGTVQKAVGAAAGMDVCSAAMSAADDARFRLESKSRVATVGAAFSVWVPEFMVGMTVLW